MSLDCVCILPKGRGELRGTEVCVRDVLYLFIYELYVFIKENVSIFNSIKH